MPTDPQHSGDVRVGVIGAGQLARMMGEASHEVAARVTVLGHDAACTHVTAWRGGAARATWTREAQ